MSRIDSQRRAGDETVERLRCVVRASGLLEDMAVPPLSPEVTAQAMLEGLGPLLGARVCGGTLATERAEDAQKLAAQHLIVTGLEAQQHEVLERIAAPFVARGIPFVLLKGIALRGRVYPSGTRSMSDLDLLVPRERFDEALAAGQEAGFGLKGDARRALTVSRYHERVLTLDGSLVDLHAGLSAWPLFTVPHAELFARAHPDPAACGGLQLPAEELFVSLALHATQHGFMVPLRSTVDALGTIVRLAPDPVAVVTTARRWGVATGTALLLAWLERLGFAAAAWSEARRQLAPGCLVDRFAKELPFDDKVAGWRWGLRIERRRRARLLDSRARAMLFTAYRGALLVGDLALRLTPQAWRERLQGTAEPAGRATSEIERSASDDVRTG